MEQSIKLFVTLGTQKFPFDRLLKVLDEWVKAGLYKKDEILIQVKELSYYPKHLNCVELLTLEQFNFYLNHADLIITHAGTGNIISCLKERKKFIIVPRLSKYGEHVDDNQLEIASIMQEKVNALVAKDMNELEKMIDDVKEHQFREWKSNKDNLIQSIRSKVCG